MAVRKIQAHHTGAKTQGYWRIQRCNHCHCARKISYSRQRNRPAAATPRGHLTNRYMGGGHKPQNTASSTSRENKDGIPAVVKSIEYDPNRSAGIALLYYIDGSKAYIIAPNGLEVCRPCCQRPGRCPSQRQHTSLQQTVGTLHPLH